MPAYNLDYIISAVDKFTPALSRIDNKIKDSNERLAGFTKLMNKWGHGMQDVGTSITKYVTAPILAAGTAALYESAKFEGYARTLRYVTGSAEAGQAMLEKLFKFEGRTPFDVGVMVKAVKTLHGIGYSAQGAVAVMEKIGDVAAGSGADLDQLAFAYGRVAMRGRMTSRELISFMRMGVPIKEMAKALGMSTQQMALLAQHSQITAQQVQKAFQIMSGEGGIFHNAMQEKLGMISTAVFKFKDAIEQMLARLGDIIKVALPIVPALHRVTAIIERLTDRMAEFAKAHPTLTKMIIWAALFAAAIGPVIVALGTGVIVLGQLAFAITSINAAIPILLLGIGKLVPMWAVLSGGMVVSTVTVGAVLAIAAAVLSLGNALRLVWKYREAFTFAGLKDAFNYVTGQQAQYLGPQQAHGGGPGVAVQQVNSNSSFQGRLEIVAPKGSVKALVSKTMGTGDFDIGLNMAGAGGY